MGTAMYVGVTGLLAHQRRMDVVANNIANVNTPGYRASRVLFQDLFSQTLQGGSAAVGDYGGQNPMQVGLGVGIGSIDVLHQQGSLFTTGVNSDLAIQGNGFFILNDGTANRYSRDGSFTLNVNGVLVEPGTGARVMGYAAVDGAINTEQELSAIQIPLGGEAIVRQTTTVTFAGNLDAAALDGSEAGTEATVLERTVRVYDSQGGARDVRLTFTKHPRVSYGEDIDGNPMFYNAWTWSATYNGEDITNIPADRTGVVLFDANGQQVFEGAIETTGAPPTETYTFTPRADLGDEYQTEALIPVEAFTGASIPAVPLGFSLDLSAVTEYAADSDITITNQDGYPRGVLESFAIGGDGTISGVFTNGLTQVLGQVALANFANVGGLARDGDNQFIETPSSGLPQIGPAGTGGRGSVSGGVLESSNVDLGTEFSNMIITQRGFQANARTITTADTMLQEAVNLVR